MVVIGIRFAAGYDSWFQYPGPGGYAPFFMEPVFEINHALLAYVVDWGNRWGIMQRYTDRCEQFRCPPAQESYPTRASAVMDLRRLALAHGWREVRPWKVWRP